LATSSHRAFQSPGFEARELFRVHLAQGNQQFDIPGWRWFAGDPRNDLMAREPGLKFAQKLSGELIYRMKKCKFRVLPFLLFAHVNKP
jgi:hypothetical protein